MSSRLIPTWWNSSKSLWQRKNAKFTTSKMN